MRIVFMGTPDFAVPTLTALIEGGHEVVAVVTQPDKPKGRGKAVLMTPVKEKAIEYEIPVYQPVKVRDPEFVELLKTMAPDAIVVVAFGQILPKSILDLPKYGCVNVHASLLPKYRGAAPIQWAVIDGEKESGVTTMMMDVGLDTGDMLEQKAIPLDEKETGGSLFDKLSALGGSMILSTLKGLENGTITRTPQGESGTSYAKMLTKEMGHIDWTKDAVSIGASCPRFKSVAKRIYIICRKDDENLVSRGYGSSGRKNSGKDSCDKGPAFFGDRRGCP